MISTLKRWVGNTVRKTYNWGSFGIDPAATQVHWYDDERGGWWGPDSAENAYTSNAIAYACIKTQARDVAGVPLLFLRDPEDPESLMPDNDPLKQLFTRPTPFLDQGQFLELCMIWRLLRGECFVVFIDGNGGQTKPTFARGMTPAYDPLGWKEVRNAEGTELVGWRYRSAKYTASFLPYEIMQDKLINPHNPTRGLSPLMAAARSVEIDSRGDRLSASYLRHGGEDALMLKQTEDASYLRNEQEEQLRQKLYARRKGTGEVSRDFILPLGLDLVDPKFTKADLDVLATQGPSIEKICFVYGMNPFIIGKGDAAKYDSSAGIIRLYWERTLIPQLAQFEAMWDAYFVQQHGMKTYVRFDKSKIAALQKDKLEQAKIAAVYLSKHLPFAEVNRVLNLGFDSANVPQAEDPLVPATMLPLSMLGAEPAPAEPPKEGPTNADIRKRAKDVPARIRRRRRLAKLERGVRSGWRNVLGEFKSRAVQLLRQSMPAGPDLGTVSTFMALLAKHKETLGDDLLDVVSPAHREAWKEGVVAIQRLVTPKAGSYAEHCKVVTFTPNAEELMKRRGFYIQKNVPEALFDEINEAVHGAVADAVAENQALGEVEKRIRHVFNTSQNQAKTIARTEVGTLFNTARFDEMGGQGFTEHEWITSADELVRSPPDSDFDHAACDGAVRKIGDRFPCGLTHPMQDGGAAGNVINCRCETIPVVKD